MQIRLHVFDEIQADAFSSLLSEPTYFLEDLLKNVNSLKSDAD